MKIKDLEATYNPELEIKIVDSGLEQTLAKKGDEIIENLNTALQNLQETSRDIDIALEATIENQKAIQKVKTELQELKHFTTILCIITLALFATAAYIQYFK